MKFSKHNEHSLTHQLENKNHNELIEAWNVRTHHVAPNQQISIEPKIKITLNQLLFLFCKMQTVTFDPCEFAALHAPFHVKLLFARIKRINSFFCVLVCFKTRTIANGIVSQLWARDSSPLASWKKRMKAILHSQPAVFHCHWIIFDSLNRQQKIYTMTIKCQPCPNGIFLSFCLD